MSYCRQDYTDERNRRYHDEEWGVPLHDDRGQFEYLMLEVMQCGLRWDMILQRREIFRACFAGFDFDLVAAFAEEDVQRILAVPGMIRSRRKIEAIICNARCFQAIRAEAGSFSDWLWAWTDGKTICYTGHADGYIPASNGLSDRISRELKRRGFRYVGPVTIYSHLQACGIINDHDRSCPCRQRLLALYPAVECPPDAERDVRYYGDSLPG